MSDGVNHVSEAQIKLRAALPRNGESLMLIPSTDKVRPGMGQKSSLAEPEAAPEEPALADEAQYDWVPDSDDTILPSSLGGQRVRGRFVPRTSD